MPIHYVKRDELAAEIERFEAAGEQVASVVAEGDNFQVFTTKVAHRAAPGTQEKRPRQ